LLNRRTACWSSFVAVALFVCAAQPIPSRADLVRLKPDTTGTPPTTAVLPPGLSLPGGVHALQHVVRIITADIDDDGDLDVVANDGTLQLAVWENDGAGHLTRKHPNSSSGWQADSPGASWDSEQASAPVLLQNDAPSLKNGAAPVVAFDISAGFLRTSRAHTPAAPIRYGSSRAPPGFASARI
jgi:hypothetical protein